jgi:dienelactone hydrolase
LLACLVVFNLPHPVLARDSPWDLDELRREPIIEWGVKTEYPGYELQRLYYSNVAYEGRPTRVFAYLARPRGMTGRAPGIVLVHGGAGKAFPEWAAQWAGCGYVALAMDLDGRDDHGSHLADGGPGTGNGSIITDLATGSIHDMWPYQAVAAATRAVTILTNEPEVNSDQVGILGISWGSCAAGVVASLDHRVAFAILAYGCGFLQEDSSYRELLAAMPESARLSWIKNFDQSSYLAGLRAPVLWLAGTNDHFFYLDSLTKSQAMTNARSTTLRVLPNWHHGYETVWQTKECRIFADQVTRRSEGLDRVTRAGKTGDRMWADYEGPAPIIRAELECTSGAGAWETRTWGTRPARIDAAAATVAAQAPPGTTAAFINITDDRGAVTSSPCWIAN